MWNPHCGYDHGTWHRVLYSQLSPKYFHRMNFFLFIPLSEIRIHSLVVSTASWILTLIPLCSIRFQSVASSEKIHNRSNCSVVVQVNSFRSKDGVGILELKFLISLFSQKTKISSFQGTPIYQFGHLRFRLLRSFNVLLCSFSPTLDLSIHF